MRSLMAMMLLSMNEMKEEETKRKEEEKQKKEEEIQRTNVRITIMQ